MVTLTGKITDVTGRTPDLISNITVKAPSARIGGGSDIVITSPAEVTFDKTTGDITISGLHVGLSWLYTEGEGWSDSIPLATAEGFQLILEAVANASGVPGIADYVAMIRSSGSHARLLARAAVEGEFGEVVRLTQAAAADAAQSAQSAENTVDSYTPRVEALESMAGLSPESPVDGQTASLISQQGTLTRSAVYTAVESRVDGRFLPNDTTYGLVPRLVHHGTVAGVARPDIDGPVIWLGVPMPIHSQPGDVLLRPAGVEWAPDWLNLAGWYDPSTLVPGGAATFVEDLSGRKNHLNITGGTGTITVRESALAHPSLYFDGASWISSGPLSQGQWTHPTTVWIVVAFDEVIGNAMSIFDSASRNRSVIFISNRGRFSAGAGKNHFGTEVVPLGTPTLLMVNFAGDETSHGELNGEQSFGPVDLGNGMPDSHRLGANGAGVNQFKGEIGEVIIASGATASEREAVTTYLMDKWGIA